MLLRHSGGRTEEGAYYLPYQIIANNDQILTAYPHAPEFHILKK